MYDIVIPYQMHPYKVINTNSNSQSNLISTVRLLLAISLRLHKQCSHSHPCFTLVCFVTAFPFPYAQEFFFILFFYWIRFSTAYIVVIINNVVIGICAIYAKTFGNRIRNSLFCGLVNKIFEVKNWKFTTLVRVSKYTKYKYLQLCIL